MDIKVDASDVAELAARLRVADKVVARNIRKQIRTIAEPLAEVVLDEGSEPMPVRGGLRARLLASGKFSVSVTKSGVALTLRTKAAGLGALNRGSLRHPLFGSRSVWFQQSVPAGTYTDAVDRHKGVVVDAVAVAVDDALRELI